MDRRRLLSLVALASAVPALALAAAEKKKAGGASYLPVPTLLGATLKPDGRRGVLSVECGLDVPDGVLRSRAEASLPRLRAAYVVTIQTYAAGLPTGSAPNADFIARALQQQTDMVLGRPGAHLLLGAILLN